MRASPEPLAITKIHVNKSINLLFALSALIRHYLLHLLIALSIYILLAKIGIQINGNVWFLSSIFVDLDHLYSLSDNKNKRLKAMLIELKSNKDFATKLTKVTDSYWKYEQGFDNLIFHKLSSIVVFTCLFVLFLYLGNNTLYSALGGALTHQIVDIAGDYFRWGNLKHWTSQK